MPKRWPSGAVQAVPVLFDTGAQTGDDALGNPSPLHDRCGPGRLTFVAGIEPLELIAAKNDDGVEASNLGGDMVLPTLTGVGLSVQPRRRPLWRRCAGPTSASRAQPRRRAAAKPASARATSDTAWPALVPT